MTTVKYEGYVQTVPVMVLIKEALFLPYNCGQTTLRGAFWTTRNVGFRRCP